MPLKKTEKVRSERFRDVREILSELVACASVNPGERKSWRSPFGEDRFATLLREKLESLEATVTIREVKPGRYNTIAHFAGTDSSRRLVFEAHADTVSVEGMEGDPFDPVVKDGKMFGRGACDTKGPMAAMLLAIQRVIQENGPLPYDLYFMSTCDEEHGGSGAKALMAEGFRADAAVIAEPTELKIIRGNKGAIRFDITTHGQAVHSSTPELGRNAIYQMRRVIQMIEEDVFPSLTQQLHPIMGAPTMSVGTIQGGTLLNIVPDTCRIEVDRRLVYGENTEDIVEDMRKRLETLRNELPTFSYTMKEKLGYPPFLEEEDSAIIQIATAACERHLGCAELGVVHYATNAGFFKSEGIPCVIFGPGSIQQAHTAVEYIELDQVVQAVDMYANILQQYGQW